MACLGCLKSSTQKVSELDFSTVETQLITVLTGVRLPFDVTVPARMPVDYGVPRIMQFDVDMIELPIPVALWLQENHSNKFDNKPGRVIDLVAQPGGVVGTLVASAQGAIGQQAQDEQAQDEQAQDEQAQDEQARDEQAIGQQAQDEQAQGGAQGEQAQDSAQGAIGQQAQDEQAQDSAQGEQAQPVTRKAKK